jgi:hypothetical protein
LPNFRILPKIFSPRHPPPHPKLFSPAAAHGFIPKKFLTEKVSPDSGWGGGGFFLMAKSEDLSDPSAKTSPTKIFRAKSSPKSKRNFGGVTN